MNEVELHKARLTLVKDFQDGKITADEHLEELAILEANSTEEKIDDMIESSLEDWEDVMVSEPQHIY